jgi:transposase-like protein
MSYVKRKDSAGRSYYIDPATGKRVSEMAYKRSLSAKKVSKTQFKTAEKYACGKAGKNLVTKNSSSAGKALKNCVKPANKRASQKAMFANIARRSGF